MNSSNGDRPQRRPGFPIRTPSDQRLVGSSPRPIAASHVLHRPTMPRHPPCALTTQHTNTQEQSQTEKLHEQSNLQKNKMLASTIQFSHNTHTPQNKPPHSSPPAARSNLYNRNNNTCVIPDTQQRTNNQPTQKRKAPQTPDHHTHTRRPPSMSVI